MEGKPVHFFRARQGGVGSGVALFAETNGYSGVIRILLGIDANGTFNRSSRVKSYRNPGLGDAIDLSKSQWVLSFNGKSLQQPDEKAGM